jgi:6-phosphogluconolactonase
LAHTHAEALTGVDIANQKVAAQALVAPTKSNMPSLLNAQIVEACQEAISNRGVVTMPLSGGLLPSFLSTCHELFDAMGVDAQFDKWHVLLADERCVIRSARPTVFQKRAGPPISNLRSKLEESTEAIAQAHEAVVRRVLC